MFSFTCSELRISSGTTCHSGTLARMELDVVDKSTERNFRERKSVPHLRSNACSGSDDLSYFQSVWRNDVSLFAIFIFYQCDTCAAVRIVLYSEHLCLAVVLVTQEIDDTVHSLMAATDVTHCHFTLIVTTACLLERGKQRFVRGLAGNVIECADYLVSLTGSYRFEFSYCHFLFPLLNISVEIYLVITGKSHISFLKVIHAASQNTGFGKAGLFLSVVVQRID